jgi:hypothetical protein
MGVDAVVIGSVLCVIGASVIVGYCVYRAGQLIKEDAERHSK